MAEFKLERFKYNWRGAWTTGAAYKRDDVVRVNGKSYVCVITHTASAAFRSDLTAILPGSSPPQPQPKWVVMTSGRSFVGDWTLGTDYNLGDVVKYNGSLWLCAVSHAASNFATDFDNWETFAQGLGFVGNWASSTTYAPGAIVKYNGMSYKCVREHISETTLEAALGEDSTGSWVVYHEGIEVRNDWTAGTEYRLNDLVKYGATVYRCIETHTSSGSSLDDTKFEIEAFGSQYDGEWNNTAYYNIGDIVRHRGFMYYAVNNNTDSRPYNDNGNINWILLSRSYSFIGSWAPTTITVTSTTGLVSGMILTKTSGTGVLQNNTKVISVLSSTQFTISITPSIAISNMNITATLDTQSISLTSAVSTPTIYKTGDIVLRGGNLYLALRDIADSQSVDGSTLDYLEDDTWELVIPGKTFKNEWSLNEYYSVGDVVYFKGSAYTCNFEHSSTIINAPEDNGSGYFYWDLLLQAGRPAALNTKGDMLTYGPSRFIDYLDSTVFDDSTFGDTRVPIGNEAQLLSVSAELEAFWRDIVVDADTVYVSTNGVDEIGGGSPENPFKTIRYAAEYVEDNFPPLTPTIVKVSTGKFEEIGPIIVPAGCAINGDELRSTTVLAAPALAEYQNDFQYVTAYLDHLITILVDIITGRPITPTSGNSQAQITEIFVPVIGITGLPDIDPITGEILTEDTFPTSSVAGANAVVNLFTVFTNYISFRVANGEIDPAVTGSNILNANQTIANAGLALEVNEAFIQQEILAFLRLENPSVTFSEIKTKNDIHSLIRAIKRDLQYSGNYATTFAARRYSNAVTGSQLDSLFFLRDTTGLRDCTTGGLQGTLNPPGVFELYQKPTGGALVSLDPGWGPDDTRAWIVNRSPYIQGVTNTGFGCIGMKVDGALHNGGNKSMTANDFTQVLSDGIGAWITNNGRAELVSVFTYYCQIGYFAESGGIIRAANGNNSYGRYGSVADGVDAAEIPQTATFFNRNNQAQVFEAFAGGNTDELIAFEYSNAGEQYTSATASVVGAGADATVEYTDFRDGALFEARLTSPDGSSRKGGSGYVIKQGSAQATIGASSTIKLSSNDATQFLSEIEGMRIIITDGTGVGQYGYIDNFVFASKLVTVRRDSDGELGWDHIIPGTPLVTDLDTTTRYRIEPRISVSAPAYSTAPYNLFTNRSYVDVQYGNTTQTYTNITSGTDLLWRDDNTTRITIADIISDVALQFTADFATNPTVPFNIKGITSGATATVTAISANTGEIIEVDITSGGSSFVEGEEIYLVFSAGSGDTFDDAPVPARFTVVRAGESYSVSLTNAGAGYNVNDVIIVAGTALGGATPANDLTIRVTSVSLDSTSSIQTFTTTGTGKTGRFVALTNAEYVRYSENGQNWTEVSLSFIGDNRALINGNNRFIAVANNESRVSSSLTGQTWTTVNLPITASWTDGTYGGGKFVIIADDTNDVAVSANGTTWTTATIPDDAGGADSSVSQWSKVVYGKGKFVAVSRNDLATATSTDGGVTWVRNDEVLPNVDWTASSLAYGNNRFLLLAADGTTAYSFDGVTWYAGTTASAALTYTEIKYAQGLFFAVGLDGSTATTLCATSEDGLIWVTRTLPASQRWSALTNGLVDGISKWVVLASAASTGGVAHVSVGARAKCRADVTVGVFNTIKIWDSGSGYSSSNLPILTITDPNFVTEVAYESRISNGVLSQPDFINRGAGYRRTTSTITISGNGYADIVPDGNIITISGVVNIPSPGVQIEIAGILNPATAAPDDLLIFSGVIITDLGDDGTGNETRLIQLTITPSLETSYNVVHETALTLREKFSQCRVSGHDFLDIGTGNFEETNYPTLYSGGAFFVSSPENEVYETNSGRVFYVSTDQDGNFRAGELFSVEQSTGVVTISAQFFNLDGLSQLSLGGVRLGGSGTVISEFSTDSSFAADSNNVIPTQRAIATFLASRLSVGGESLEVNGLQAGAVILGGVDNEMNTVGGYLQIPADVNFDGTFESDDGAGAITTNQTDISGTIVSQMLFLKKFDDTMQ